MAGGFIAARAHEPRLALDDHETKMIAGGVIEVSRHSNIPVSPATQAWIALATIVGGIYASKIMTIKMEGPLR